MTFKKQQYKRMKKVADLVRLGAKSGLTKIEIYRRCKNKYPNDVGDQRTWFKYYEEDYNKGADELTGPAAKLVQDIVGGDVEGSSPDLRFKAASFVLERKGGWSNKQELDVAIVEADEEAHQNAIAMLAAKIGRGVEDNDDEEEPEEKQETS